MPVEVECLRTLLLIRSGDIKISLSPTVLLQGFSLQFKQTGSS